MSNHFAFLVDCPNKGEVMMFPNYYEKIKNQLDESYEEVIVDISTLPIYDMLKSHNYKFFKQKETNNDQN